MRKTIKLIATRCYISKL